MGKRQWIVPTVVASVVAAHAVAQVQPTPPLTLTTRRMPASGSFSQPVFLTQAPGDPDRLFVVEKGGRIKILSGVSNGAAGSILATPFLTVANTATGTESGLLGMAFAPDFKTSGVFYIFHTWGGDASLPSGSVIARYHVSADPNIADAASREVVYHAPRSAGIHNGGWIAFGRDGMLWATLGDNASSGNSQNLTSPHGKLIRIDPTRDDYPADDRRNFGVPANNPLVAALPPNALPEIFAYGLRNPWRCSFDRLTGDLYIGDVGGSTSGEIDVLPLGVAGGGVGGAHNFGWPCFDSATTGSNISNCGGDAAAITQGIWVYPRSLGGATTGGYVYRGCAIPEVQGLYFFADYTSNRAWTLPPRMSGLVDSATVVERTSEFALPGSPGLAAMGEDSFGEVYLLALNNGAVFKIVPRVPSFRDLNANGIPDDCEPPFCGPADIAGLGGGIGPDNQLTADDLIAMLDGFFAGNLAVADLATLGGAGGPDGQLTPDDLVFFLDEFFGGCP